MKFLIRQKISIHVPFDKLVHQLRHSKSDSIEKNKITSTRIDFDFVYRYARLNRNKMFNAVITPFPEEKTSSLISIKVLPSYLFGIPLFLGAFLTFLTWQHFFNLKTALIIWIMAAIGHYLYLLIKFQDNTVQLLTEVGEIDKK